MIFITFYINGIQIWLSRDLLMWAVAQLLQYSSSVEVISTINPTIVLKHKMPPWITTIFFHIYSFSFITFKDKVEILIYVKKNRPKDIHTNLQLVLSCFKTLRVFFSKNCPPSQTVSKPILLCKLATGAMTAWLCVWLTEQLYRLGCRMLQKSSGQCCLIGKLSHTSDSGCVICLTFDGRQRRERDYF